MAAHMAISDVLQRLREESGERLIQFAYMCSCLRRRLVLGTAGCGDIVSLALRAPDRIAIVHALEAAVQKAVHNASWEEICRGQDGTRRLSVLDTECAMEFLNAAEGFGLDGPGDLAGLEGLLDTDMAEAGGSLMGANSTGVLEVPHEQYLQAVLHAIQQQDARGVTGATSS